MTLEPIPDRVYFAQGKFFSLLTYRQLDEEFHAKWLARSSEFPSFWFVRDSAGVWRGVELAVDAATAISRARAKCNSDFVKGDVEWTAHSRR